jgi:hypothetical protein
MAEEIKTKRVEGTNGLFIVTRENSSNRKALTISEIAKVLKQSTGGDESKK